MARPRPTVSLGLPVFNGENYLEEAIESILAQTYTDYELILSDNASTDGTEQICRRHASRDPRIQYHRNRINLGAAPNFNRTFEIAEGTYFKWCAHDDRIAPRYLERCVDVLDRDPSVVACQSRVEIIDASGSVVATSRIDSSVDAVGPDERFRTILLADPYGYWAFALFRAGVLGQTPLIASYVASDLGLRAELALRGRFREVPECLFQCRDHAERSIRSRPAFRARAAWFDPRLDGRWLLPSWRLLGEYIRAVARVPLSRGERLRCGIGLLRFVAGNLTWARMLLDPLLVIAPSASAIIPRLGRIRRRVLGEPVQGVSGGGRARDEAEAAAGARGDEPDEARR